MSGETLQYPTVPQPSAPAGPVIPSGATVVQLVSTGPASFAGGLVEVPDVVGKRQADALTALQNAGFQVEVLRIASSTIPSGAVAHQIPAARAQAASGSKVGILTSTGRAAEGTPGAYLPDVVGKGRDEAAQILQQAGLKSAVIEAASPSVPAGVVFAQEPNARSLAAAPPKKSLLWLWVVLGVIAAALVAFFLFSRGTAGPEVEVPTVVGVTVEQAEATLTEAGFVLGRESQEETDAAEPGTVVAQTPAAGEMLAKGGRVDVVVAVAIAGVEVPDVVGMSSAAARAQMEGAGLTVRVTETASDDVTKGDVIEQSPRAGTRVEAGAEIALTVSSGAAPVQNVSVPNVTGMTESEARSALGNAGLSSRTLLASSDSVPAKDVVGQAPAAGSSVAPGTQIYLVVSEGPLAPEVTLVPVPNVTGMSQADAGEALEDAGLTPEAVEVASPGAAGVVVSQLPAAGDEVAEGSTVYVFISKGQAE
ncbi:MAG: PASTA domain-containing protein [Coriobacteriia bacterium]|nr:PASTA domain-containing protein [Coriobacteriia bacterium]